MFDFLRTRPETRSSYTESAIQAMVDGALASTSNLQQTGALETAANIIAKGFISSTIQNAPVYVMEAISAEWLGYVGRNLIRCGEVVFKIEVSEGSVMLIPAADWDVRGDPNPTTWLYDLTMAGPNRIFTQTLPGSAVVHIRYATDPHKPWKGIGPLESARIAGKLSAGVNQALQEEVTNMPRGGVLTIPQEATEETSALKTTFAKLRGSLFITKTTQGAYGGDMRNKPKTDMEPTRIGAAPPQYLVQLRNDSDTEILAACGVPPELASGQAGGGAGREAWRRLLFGTLRPLGLIIQEELRDKMDAPSLEIDWAEIRASDIAGRMRAMKGGREAGLSMKDASLNSGIVLTDDYDSQPVPEPTNQAV